MDLSTLHHGVHRLKKKKRVGRGIGSGHGKTSSHGGKGQHGRTGAKLLSILNEGGQMPLFRRIPKRGFNNNTWRKTYIPVNVGDLDKHFADGATVDHEALKKAGLANGPADGVRILGQGDVTKRLLVTAHHFSKSALEKIQAKKGTATVVAPPKPPKRNKMRPRPPKQQQT